MPRRSAILRKGFLLLLAASLLLPSLSMGAEDRCCATGTAAGGCDDRLAAPSPGAEGGTAPAHGDHGAGDGGGAHSKGLCDCGACELLSLLGDGHPLLSPGMTERIGRLPMPVPPSVPLSTPERPPLA